MSFIPFARNDAVFGDVPGPNFAAAEDGRLGSFKLAQELGKARFFVV